MRGSVPAIYTVPHRAVGDVGSKARLMEHGSISLGMG